MAPRADQFQAFGFVTGPTEIYPEPEHKNRTSKFCENYREIYETENVFSFTATSIAGNLFLANDHLPLAR